MRIKEFFCTFNCSIQRDYTVARHYAGCFTGYFESNILIITADRLPHIGAITQKIMYTSKISVYQYCQTRISGFFFTYPDIVIGN